MNNELDIKQHNVEQYIINIAEQLNKEKQGTISDETLKKGIEEFTSSKYDSYTEEQIYKEINEIIQKMLEERELRKQEFLKQQQELRQAKFEELRKLYLETKEKYQNMDYSIVQTMDTKYMQSYNGTKEVQLMNQLGETLYGFYKGVSSPNEYELLVSRLGKICDILVANYSLYLDNGTIDGISISCIPDKERYDFISGYDFVKIYPEVNEVVSRIKNNPEQPKPELSRDQTQYYMDILLKGFAERVKNPEQLEQLKKDYFKAVLFNAILDQKDFNYTNFAVLYDKVNDSYQMAPLFDNGAIKNNDSLEGTYITTLGRSKKEDVIDLLFTEYYDYVSDFAKQLVSENEKLNNGETNMISDMMTCIDDTIIHSEAESYKQVVQSTLEKVVEREKIKQNVQDIYYQYPTEDRSKDIKGKVYIMPPNAAKGFNCGYSLFIPDGCQPDTTLLVHSCNTGGAGVKDGKLDRTRTAIHLSEGNEAARLSTIKMNPGMWFGSDLKMPVLTPLIPRVQGYYTQALGSKVFENDVSTLIADNNDRPIEKRLSEQEIKQIQEQCRDLPSQLVSIISESKGVLEQLGVKIDSKVIMEGYSAGSKFANCFTALHPEMVKACISGGTSGLGILPISQLNGEKLNFPLGVANVSNFNADAFKSIPQYYYIGNQDYNDPAMVSDKSQDSQGELQPRYKENYTPHEITQIQTQLGKNPQERFDNNQKMYAQLGVNAKFQKFNGDHNSVTQQRDNNGNFITNESVKGFIREVVLKEKTIQQTQQTKSSEPVRSQLNDTPKNSESFSQRSQSEIQVHQQIKQKNQAIKQQKAQKQQLNKPKVKTLSAPSSQGNRSSGNKGYTNIILLSLIVSFVCGALFMVVYMLIKG